MRELLYQRPTKVDSEEPDPLVDTLAIHLSTEPWIHNIEVRMRQEGILLAGEIYITPQPGSTGLSQKMADLKDKAIDYHWRIYDIVTTLQDLSAEKQH